MSATGTSRPALPGFLSEDRYDIFELLHADRDLTAEEMAYVTAYGNKIFEQLPSIGAALIGQRNRFRALWLEVEQSSSQDFLPNLEKFRTALGLDD